MILNQLLIFGVVGKLPEDALNSKFIKNNQGILTEKSYRL